MINLIFILAITGAKAFGANNQVYQVVYHLSENGKMVGSSSVIIEEGKAGEVKSMTEGIGGSSLNVTVRSTSDQTLQVDYRFKNIKGKKQIELAKSSVTFTSGKSETNKFEDSSGNSFELAVVVTKK